jgi:hypothetical protein
MRNTAYVTVEVVGPSPSYSSLASGVSAVVLLVAFYDIPFHPKKGLSRSSRVLFYYSVPDTTRDKDTYIAYIELHNVLTLCTAFLKVKAFW